MRFFFKFMIMLWVLIKQICRHKFSIKSVIAVLVVSMFIVSVINNHFLIIQVGDCYNNVYLKLRAVIEKLFQEKSNIQKTKDE